MFLTCFQEMSNSKQATHIRINHRVLDDAGDNYIWFYKQGESWLVQFGYCANTRIVSKSYSSIDNLLADYPYEP